MPVFHDGEKIEYGGKEYGKFLRKIDLYNPARCGGIFILQVLDCIFQPGPRMLHVHTVVNQDDYMVVVYRNFLDKLASHIRAESYNRVPNEQDRIFYGCLNEVIQDIGTLDKNKKAHANDKKILWLKYEDFVNNYSFIFDKLEKFFGIKIDEGMKKYVISQTNIEKNRKRMNKLMKDNPELDFSYDDRSGFKLHPAHINPDPSKGWQETIPQRYHSVAINRLNPYLKKWGYDPVDN